MLPHSSSLSLLGKFLAAGFMAFGALTISLPVMSIVTKFLTVYVKNIEGTNIGFGFDGKARRS